jgi:biotin transport system substrate-specific component
MDSAAPERVASRPPMPSGPLVRMHRLVWTALLAACIAVGAWLQLPIGPVPITLQPLFVFLAGYLLGPGGGAAAVALYVAAGVLGLPVFAGGALGIGVLLGPTGGYLVGMIGAAATTGLAAPPGRPLVWARGLLFGALAVAVNYAVGAARLAQVLDLGVRQALVVGVAPFVVFDVVKVVVALVVARHLRAQRLAPP